MITALLIFIPLVCSLFLFFTKQGNSKTIALLFSIIELAVTLFAATRFQVNAEPQFVIDVPWVYSLGIHFHVAMDGISLLLVLLTSFLTPLIILSSFRQERSPAFYALILLMQSGLVGVFTSFDGFLFYIFWEVALIPAYLICLLWGGEQKVHITFRFFIYTLMGSLLMLVALIFMYLKTPAPHSFDIRALYALNLDASTQGLIFWAMFIAFAIKMPVFPFHSWQPDTYTDAPPQGTMLLSGIMLKMGVYGVLRWLLPIAPLGVKDWGSTALVLSVIGIIYGSCLALVQKDFKRLIAYSSIAHVGLIAAGVFSLNIQGLQGSMMQMMSHGVYVVALFFICDIIETRSDTRDISLLGGIRSQAPVFSTLFIIIVLGSIGLPLTSGFIGEFLLLSGVFQFNPWIAGVAGLTVILGAVYMLTAYQKIMLGDTNPSTHKFEDLVSSEKIVLVVAALFIIGMGIYPKPILSMAEPALLKILEFTAH